LGAYGIAATTIAALLNAVFSSIKAIVSFELLRKVLLVGGLVTCLGSWFRSRRARHCSVKVRPLEFLAVVCPSLMTGDEAEEQRPNLRFYDANSVANATYVQTRAVTSFVGPQPLAR
jgi:hypothetical protein